MGLWGRRIPLIQKQHVLFIFLGFASGVPFLLTLSTLSAWLVESGVTRTAIGLFVLVTTPYTFKFLISPWIDLFYIPYLTPRFGQRRSCALFSQFFLILCLIGLGLTHPRHHLWLTACMAFCVCLSAAIQDLVIEAYRVEITSGQSRGVVASALCLGFRFGLMVSGAGALYLASFLPWSTVYALMALCVTVGMIAILLSPEPTAPTVRMIYKLRKNHLKKFPLHLFWARGVRRLFRSQEAWIILLFILFYKLGDTVLNVMNVPFLMALGYSKVEIAEIAKFFGTTAMICGGFLGGWCLVKRGLWWSLCMASSLQILSCFSLMLQAWLGYHPPFLIVVMGIENLASGLATTVFLAYLGALCKPPFTATQYAFLASFGSCARIIWSIAGGIFADHFAWPGFFFLVLLGCTPGLFILLRYSPSFQQVWEESPSHT